MDAQTPQSLPGGYNVPPSERYIHKRFERFERLSDGTSKRSVNVDYCAPDHDDRIDDLSTEELDSWFGTMHIVEETIVFKRLPGDGWNRITVKSLHAPLENENQQVSSEEDRQRSILAPVSTTPSQMPGEPMMIIASPACAPPLEISKPAEESRVSPRSGQNPESFDGSSASKSGEVSPVGPAVDLLSSPEPARRPSVASSFETPLAQPSAFQVSSLPEANSQSHSGSQTGASFPKSALTTAVGTKSPPFQPPRIEEHTNFHVSMETITAQPFYLHYSLEELRAADYAQGRSRVPLLSFWEGFRSGKSF